MARNKQLSIKTLATQTEKHHNYTKILLKTKQASKSYCKELNYY